MHRRHQVALFLVGVPVAPCVARSSPRRVFVEQIVQIGFACSSCVAAALLTTQVNQIAQSTPSLAGTEWQDPLGGALRSSTGSAARLERAALEHEWHELREAQSKGLIGMAETQAAFAQIVSVRNIIVRSEELARAKRVAEIDPLITRSLIAELERASTLLASSPILSQEDREAIGWQWGACGFKRCGAQADAAQSLSKLRANLGMVVPLEALFYLDIAKRAVDEMLQLGISAGLLAASALPPASESSYLSRETLEMILPAEDVATGDANLVVMKGGTTEAEDALEEYEASMLEELERSLDAGRTSSEDSNEV